MTNIIKYYENINEKNVIICNIMKILVEKNVHIYLI